MTLDAKAQNLDLYPGSEVLTCHDLLPDLVDMRNERTCAGCKPP